MKVLFLLISFFSALGSYSQTMQATIKPGSTPKTIDIYLKSSASFSQKDESMTFTIAIPANVLPSPSMGSSGVTQNSTGPVPGITGLQPNFLINNFGATQREVFVSTESIGGTSYFIYTFICIGTATINHDWIKDIKQLIFSIQFNGCTSNCDPINELLVNLPNGGTNGNSYWYFQSNTIGDITNYQNPFYQNSESTIPVNGGSADGSILSYIGLTNPVALPIILKSFNAVADNCDAKISWTATKEDNLQSYIIERSENGVNFYEIGTLKAASQNSSGINNYTFSDNATSSHLCYYRLKMIDRDGKWKESPIVQVKLKCVREGIVSIFPTRSDGIFNIKIQPGYESVIIKVVNSIGQEVCKDVSLKLLRTIDLGKFANGIYTVHIIKDRAMIDNEKIVLLH